MDRRHQLEPPSFGRARVWLATLDKLGQAASGTPYLARYKTFRCVNEKGGGLRLPLSPRTAPMQF